MANESYRIEYQPQLVEDTVLWVIAGHPEEKSFRKERNPIYQLQNEEVREENFQVLHERWYDHLGLSESLHMVLAIWPIIKLQTHKCQVLKARSKKDVGTELYVAADAPGVTDRGGRSIVIQVTPELLGQPQNLLTFLRHEFLHIVDMLDPQFGYKPNLPKSENGRTYDRFLQERYGILWDICIDGRLHRRGWLPASVKDAHWTIFANTFPGPQADLEKVFGFFFKNISPKHEELLSFSMSPETWFNTSNSESTIKGQCPLCHFPSFDLIDASTNLPSSLVAEIQNENPTWQSNEPICHQCADLYELRRYEKNLEKVRGKGYNVSQSTIRRAIVVDDDKSLLTAITSILKKRGYEVYTATEPSFCPIYLKHECKCPEGYKCTNILITDVKMPNMTGFEFLKELKSYRCKVQNIAVMSTVWEESELEYFEGVGCKILEKPFKMNELAKWLDECEKKIDPNFKLSNLPKTA